MGDADLDDSRLLGPRERLAENIRVLRARMEERATEPGGQELPDWITYVPYETTIDGVPVTTGSLVELPLTYYGPSIPLAQGWTYGGSTSPASTASSVSATSRQESSGSSSSSTTTSSWSSARPSRSSDRSRSRSNTRTSTASEATTSVTSATDSASTSTTRSSSGSVVSSSSSTPSSSSATLSSSSSSLTTQSSFNSSSPTASSTSTLGAAPTSSHRHLLAPLLATLIPFGLALLALLILLYLWRKKRPNRDVGFFPWLFTPKEWATVPVVTSEKPSERSKEEDPAAVPAGLRSPDENSALLPDFIAQHHRNSSSISTIAPLPLPRPSTCAGEHDPEMKDLVRQNQSLLHRLTLGLGWAPSPSPRHSGSSEGERRTSGNTAERGENPSSGVGMGGRMVSGAMAGALAAAGVFGVRKERSAAGLTTSSSGNETSGTGQKYERVLDEDQLFYRVPPQTSSSKWSNNVSSSRSRPSTGGGRQQPALPEGSSSGHETRPSMTFSVSVPETPGSRHLSERDMDVAEFGRNIPIPQISPSKVRPVSGEREHMRFPIPPGLAFALKKQPRSNSSFAGVGKEKDKDSRTSTETFYSALTGREPPAYSPELPLRPPGSPIRRDNEDYRHASVSVFGSVPATPVPAEWEGTGSSQSHTGQSNSQTGPSLSRETSPQKSLYAPSPVSPALISTARRSHVTPAGDDAIRPMKRLFGLSPTPRSSTDPREPVSAKGAGEGEGEGDNSWTGEPLIDERDLRASGDGAGARGRERQRGRRRLVGEFGEGLKSVPLAGASRTQQAPLRHSHQGSIHSSDLSSNPTSLSPAYPTTSSYQPSPLSPHAPISLHSMESHSSLAHSLSITSTSASVSASGSSSGHSVTHSTQGQGVRGKRSAALLVPAGAVAAITGGGGGGVPPVPPVPAPASVPIVVPAQEYNEKEKAKPREEVEKKQEMLEKTPKKEKEAKTKRWSPLKPVGPRPASGEKATIWGGLRR
ncbi:hypothetical protein L202_05209 [Cryptococcus amylolentus CBS 6039]|uniref:Uncharacterized protein n=1 Tax=Cryptococcus amylolentus CBS 6039 TaxID=1295533 RepID=A0A1E3HJM1_9TREE|nr:hypothetical protein L202_05209 [Cryptococcus amylolentus CBS 6039]ODN76547.1 hypothetical protein L202_05209 [Cryptococcus amylolentus CBS 6039]